MIIRNDHGMDLDKSFRGVDDDTLRWVRMSYELGSNPLPTLRKLLPQYEISFHDSGVWLGQNVYDYVRGNYQYFILEVADHTSIVFKHREGF